MTMTPPEPKWTERSKALYADWFVDCHYYEPSEENYFSRRSDADTYEQWKSVAAALGVWRTQEVTVPDDVRKMIAERYEARGEQHD